MDTNDSDVVIADCFLDDEDIQCSYSEEEGEGEDDNSDGLLVADLIAVGVIADEIGSHAEMMDTSSCAVYFNSPDECSSSSNVPSAHAVAMVGESNVSSKKQIWAVHSGARKGSMGKESKGMEVVAIAVSIEVLDDEDEVSSEGAAVDTDLVLELDPEPVILEAETVRSAPRTFSSRCMSTDDPSGGGGGIDLGKVGRYPSIERMSISEATEDVEVDEGKGGVEVNETAIEVSAPPVEFLMSWNRRIAESAIFFDLMLQAGFSCEHQGKCVYSFKVKGR